MNHAKRVRVVEIGKLTIFETRRVTGDRVFDRRHQSNPREKALYAIDPGPSVNGLRRLEKEAD